MQILCLLGRQPAIGLAELESRFGATAIKPLGAEMAVVTADELDFSLFNTLGSVLKTGIILETINSTDWYKITNHLIRKLPGEWRGVDGGKLTIGISTYSLRVRPQQINATALSLKKALRNQPNIGSVRVVPNKENELNTAQVLHNNLTAESGLELLLVRSGETTIVVQSKFVQDIEAYRRRDQERPARDARVGMLPPKLAQIIINFAATDCKRLIVDPFCGTGVVLQEALLMKNECFGSDLEPRMIDYSKKNLRWLSERFASFNENLINDLQVVDATKLVLPNHSNQAIACETYLGRPFNSAPDSEILRQVIHDVNVIHKKFLQNIANQTKAGFRMCIAVPAWHVKGSVKHLPVLDHLEELGYNRVSFVHAGATELVYHREGQIVGRELVVLTRR